MTEAEEWAVRSWIAAYEDLSKKMFNHNIMFLTRNDLAAVIQQMRKTLPDDRSE